MIDPATINWIADEWFVKHHASRLTDTFKIWWAEDYGHPSEHGNSEDEQHEYWTRCAFALKGWNAMAVHDSSVIDILKTQLTHTESDLDEAFRELRSWTDAAKVGLASGTRIGMSHTTMRSALSNVTPITDAALTNAIVTAIEAEHHHVERIAERNNGCTNCQAQIESYERMKHLAGMLERLTYQPVYIPTEKGGAV